MANTGARDSRYDLYDNDANFHPELNSQSADYFRNATNAETYGDNRWKTGGGIQVGDVDKPGGLGIFGASRSRDTDGTVDRIREPPRALLPVLYAIKMQCSAYNVDLPSTFETAGGSAYGTIAPTKFASALVVALHRMALDEETVAALVHAYGCGARAPEGSARAKLNAAHEFVGWKDFCEDVGNAMDMSTQPYPYPGGPPPVRR